MAREEAQPLQRRLRYRAHGAKAGGAGAKSCWRPRSVRIVCEKIFEQRCSPRVARTWSRDCKSGILAKGKMCAQVKPAIEGAPCGKPMETLTLERGRQFAYTEGL